MAGKILEFGDRFAVMAWYQALVLRLKETSVSDKKVTAGRIGKQFVLNITSSENPSNIFYKYRTGNSFPGTNRMMFPMDFMDLELNWLFSDYFSLLNKAPISRMTFSNPLQDYVYSDSIKGRIFLEYRDDSDWLERFKLVNEVKGLDSFFSTLAMIRQCLINKRRGTVYLYGCEVLLGQWREVYYHQILGPFADNLFDYIESKYLPESIPLVSEKNKWINVREHKTTRHRLALAERKNWEPSMARIPTTWLDNYLNEIERRQLIRGG